MNPNHLLGFSVTDDCFPIVAEISPLIEHLPIQAGDNGSHIISPGRSVVIFIGKGDRILPGPTFQTAEFPYGDPADKGAVAYFLHDFSQPFIIMAFTWIMLMKHSDFIFIFVGLNGNDAINLPRQGFLGSRIGGDPTPEDYARKIK